MQQSPEGELRQRKKGEREGGDKVEQRPDTVKGVKAEKVYGRTPDGTGSSYSHKSRKLTY